jgi:hypothetical protein
MSIKIRTIFLARSFLLGFGSKQAFRLGRFVAL